MKSLKTALINIRRMPYKSMLAIGMISITFFVVYVFSMLAIGSQLVIDHFESSPTIVAFFNIRAEDEEIAQVDRAMQVNDRVTELKLISKDEALSYYQERQTNPLLVELVTAELLPASIELSAQNPESLKDLEQELQQYSQIEEVVLQRDVIDQLVGWTNSIRTAGIGLISVLSFLSLLILISIISFKIGNQGKLVGILRILGASSGFIITPYIIEGFIYGLTGSLIGWSLMYATYLYITPWLQAMAGSIISLPPSWEFFAVQAGLGTSLAMFFGGFASILAAKKLIKR